MMSSPVEVCSNARWHRQRMQAVTDDGPVTVRPPSDASRQEEHPDRGPLSGRTRRLDAATVRVDEMAHDRQTEPGASLRAGAAGVDTIEALEDARQVLRRDPDPGIRDVEPHAFVGGARAHRDASLTRVAHRVLDEVREDLPERR